MRKMGESRLRWNGCQTIAQTRYSFEYKKHIVQFSSFSDRKCPLNLNNGAVIF